MQSFFGVPDRGKEMNQEEQQINAGLALAVAAYGRLKQSGLLKEAGNDLLHAATATRASHVADNIAAWKAYRDAGMPEELIMALMLKPGVDFGELVKKTLENAGRKKSDRQT